MTLRASQSFLGCLLIGASSLIGVSIHAAESRQLSPDLAAIIPIKPGFSTTNIESGWWLVSPEGQKFFSLGVSCVHQGSSRTSFDVENPSYAAWQHYGSSAGWADASLRKLKSWSLTTVGGWSDFATLRQSSEQTLWLTPVLHIGASVGAPWWDMWDKKNISRMESIARDQILPLRNDPRLLGYYSDNELGWWNATLWKMTLEQPPSSGQRQRLIKLLREDYQNNWTRLRQDFDPENAGSWSQLERGGMLFLKSGGNGIHAMRRFLGLLADRYYQLMRDIIRKYEARALFLGDRYQSFYYPEVARAAARYVDVVSSNLNAQWDDGTFLRCYLDTLHSLTGKPVLVSEFYLAAADNRSGNKNSAGNYPVVTTQRQRAEAARNTLSALIRLPYIIGADWFQFADEPRHGRDDGENFNFGLVDINDRPYEEITGLFTTLNARQLKSAPPQIRLNATSGIPPAPNDPLSDFTTTRALRSWDRERGFFPPVSEHPVADLYICWNARSIYLGLQAIDIVEPAYYRDASVPKNDRALWTVNVGGQEIVRARIGAGREPIASDPKLHLEGLSGLKLNNVRTIAALEIPAGSLGKSILKSGDRIDLDCTLLTHCRAYRIQWKGSFILRE